MGDVFTHIAQRYSNRVTVYSDINTPPQYTIFSSPSDRAVPTTVFVPKDRISLSPAAKNYIRIKDVSSGNKVLPNTTIEYGFYIPSFVGYGSVFSTQSEAEQDALDRLENVLGSFVSSDNIMTDSSEMTDVPSLWGPAIIEVRAWY